MAGDIIHTPTRTYQEHKVYHRLSFIHKQPPPFVRGMKNMDSQTCYRTTHIHSSNFSTHPIPFLYTPPNHTSPSSAQSLPPTLLFLLCEVYPARRLYFHSAATDKHVKQFYINFCNIFSGAHQLHSPSPLYPFPNEVLWKNNFKLRQG